MHLLAEVPEDGALKHMVKVRKRPRWVDKLRAFVLAFAARILNYRRFGGTWRVNLDKLEDGDVRVVLSVLYQPFAEMDLDNWYGAKPEQGYFGDLMEQLTRIETELHDKDEHNQRHMIVRTRAQFDEARRLKRVALVHCVEGGFHLGADTTLIDDRVKQLADKGVAYITLAHLFWRRVATNAPALPFLNDWLYRHIFCQPDVGLTPLGETIVRSMYEHKVLIDVSHMDQFALTKTFALLRDLDRDHQAEPEEFPIIATHGGFRFGRQHYMLDPDTITEIQRRDGVIGLILAQHQLNDGLRLCKTKKIEQSMKVICKHIDAIRGVTNNYAHVGFGTDLDGFIKPTMGGLETAAELGNLEEHLKRRYHDAAIVKAILSGNAERVLERMFDARA